ncbi:FAD/NAD(P)-binding oxidoreductase [Brooklawnia cerclae]|uniref:NADPH-dependent 2,4-dienoyl-CoA reductase/sulfur reductase-like enzyme n=1 Tax=Brooklawnia cerclae TaxID=349934 RepID=A0ABX0SKD3_9ACTN|nr:FAD/NAD(P)-binding oxidoreductase [Brooklawnia cerclae]NIH58833.1 NADPH-dependent 2,4-dienoyl-CoA reductase/sulfur reductase-like enzyme [Brooklawnia cerclae]
MNVVIIGAGPAGLAAAEAALGRGADVTILEASDLPGGQYWRHLPPTRPSAAEPALHHHWTEFQRLRAATERADIVGSAQVWAVERDDHGLVLRVAVGAADAEGREQRALRPDALVLATGAHDRALPVPGWTLPGVYTAGAAQAMAKGERIALGSEVVVSGAGPFLFPVTRSLGQAGAHVLGVFEASGAKAMLRGWGARPWELLAAGGKLAEMAGYLGHHLRARVPYHLGSQVIAIHGTSKVEAVTVARLDADWHPLAGTERRIPCDTVCLGHGFVPRVELAVAAGCDLTPSRHIRVDPEQHTSATEVWAAGEITTLGGVDHALATGRIAGWCAAGGSAGDPEVAGAVRARNRFAAFADRIEAAHGIRPGWIDWLRPDTLVCRCEEVSYDRIRSMLDQSGTNGLRSAKLTTRAGLGLCQGRICGRTVETLLAAHSGVDQPADGALIDRRPIAAPIALSDLARSAESHVPAPVRTEPKGRS